MVNCPQCDAVLEVEEDELDEGERMICEECGVHLVVVGTNPLEIEADDEEDDEDEDLDELDEDDYEKKEDEEADDEEEDEDEDWR